MAVLLSRLGACAARHRLLVLAVWLLVLIALGLGSRSLGTDYSDEFSIPGSESSAAQELITDQFPAAGGVTAQIVFQAPAGHTLAEPAYQAAVASSLQAVGGIDQVDGVSDPTQNVSEDGTVALATAAIGVKKADLGENTLSDVEASLAPARDAGLRVEVGGSAYGSVGEGGHTAEIAGVVTALVVLVVTFGSLLSAGLPLLTALLGVGITVLSVGLLSQVTTISGTAPTLALMIGLAVGIDYALFVLSRFRSELAHGASPDAAVATATGTAGSAVVFAGVTVVIALLGLAVVGIPFLTTMGLAAAGAVVVSVLGAVTLLPAVLRLTGSRLAPRPGSRAARREATHARAPWGERWTRWASNHPVRVLAAGVLLLATLAVPAVQLELALPTNGSSAPDSTQRKAYDLISDAFGPGVNGPLLVVADVTDSTDPQAAAAAVRETLAGTNGVARVSQPQLSPDGSTVLLQVIPQTAASDAATGELVRELRGDAGDIAARTGAQILVGGTTAAQIDVSNTLSSALVPYALVVVGLSVLLLVAVFRSIAVPVKAAFGFLLSVAAALGATVAVFQWGWLADRFGVASIGPVVSFVPIMLMAVLFGLAMDYEVFLVSRIREAVAQGVSPREAIALGGRHAGRVVVAAGFIMVGVFVAFTTMPNATLQPIAFSLAVGVLADAFVVRMTLVPAVLGLLGGRAWWLPRWLDRVLPHLDVDGEALTSPESARVPV